MAKGIHDARYRSLIDALLHARRQAGLSQSELAQRLGARQQFVSKYESGERRLDVVEFVDIGRALNVEIISLLNDMAHSDR